VFPLDEQIRIRARRAGLGLAVLSVLAYALIVLGAVVRAKGAGLACPDWPLCFGRAVPTLDARVSLEWGHRVLAASVTLGLAIITAYLVRVPELRRLAGRSLALTWGLLCVQVVLGGLTVLLGLAPWTVTSHLLVGNALCGVLLWTSRDLSEMGLVRSRARGNLPSSITAAVVLCAVLLVGQVALGGMVSGNFAGLACSAFPSCDGDSFAPTFSGLVGIHVLHRLNACALTLALVGLVFVTRSAGYVGSLARVALHIAVLQIVVGAVNVIGALPVEITALHSALAAGLFLTTALIAREARLARTATARDGAAHGQAMEPV
jgi:cytochrome c oxidase assembly protein subunit 15